MLGHALVTGGSARFGATQEVGWYFSNPLSSEAEIAWLKTTAAGSHFGRACGTLAKTSSGKSPKESRTSASASARNALSSSLAGAWRLEFLFSHATARSKYARA